jgi:alkylated DNA repair protein (DNA oxidative demethylase)
VIADSAGDDLLRGISNGEVWEEVIAPGALVLRQYAVNQAAGLLRSVEQITARSPFRHMQTPGGFTMSVRLSSCGQYGWVSDRRGYRYTESDPLTGQPWPEMPESFRELAVHAARRAGYAHFEPDACLINCYQPGTKMALHQDKNERDFSAPIVSVSLGVPANFRFGGTQRSDKPLKIPLAHGDVVVWGGVSRLNFHGVLTLRKACHPLTGDQRINLTFRKVSG